MNGFSGTKNYAAFICCMEYELVTDKDGRTEKSARDKSMNHLVKRAVTHSDLYSCSERAFSFPLRISS